jgi:NADPH:quinone reductase-like Zn-dependent oxidoreductase
MNAKVIITSSRDEKLARAKQLGAKHLINYRTTPNWEEEVLELTAGTGVDHILEVGGAQTLERSLHCLSGGGHLAFIGGLSGFETRMDPHTLLYKNACCAGIYVGSVEDLRHTLDFMAQHAIKPVIDRVFSFDKASEAYQFLASGKHFGKVVIELG